MTNPKPSKNKINNTDYKIEKISIKSSNPIDTNIIAKINTLNSTKSKNKIYSGYQNSAIKLINDFDLSDFVIDLNEICTKNLNNDLFLLELHKLASNNFNASYLAYGKLNCDKTSLDISLIDNLNNIYTSKVLTNEVDSPIIQALNKKEKVYFNNSNFLHISNIKKDKSIIIPIILHNEIKGVFIFGNVKESLMNYLLLFTNYAGLYIQNNLMLNYEIMSKDIDFLSGVFNYTKISEVLENCIKQFDLVSLAIININNLTGINKEFGFKKGDEIISSVASVLKNTFNCDIKIGRLQGDKFCIIFPKMDNNLAKYNIEHFLYKLSCLKIDDIGQIKVSIGIALYKGDFRGIELFDKALYAMYISKAIANEEGKSNVICANDINFLNKKTIKLIASSLSSKALKIGIDCKDEIVEKFNSDEIIGQSHLMDVVASLASAIDAKDEYTKGHSSSVARYSEALALALNLPQKDVQLIKLGALLHDIGKIGIPESILRKESKLNDEEWEIMKQHPSIGDEKVLRPNSSLHDLIPIVRYHHEHFDGGGYPEKLKGQEIPFAARIVSVADAYHALISDRPYRKGLSIEKACEILRMGANIQWDRDLVIKFIEIAPSLSTKI